MGMRWVKFLGIFMLNAAPLACGYEGSFQRLDFWYLMSSSLSPRVAHRFSIRNWSRLLAILIPKILSRSRLLLMCYKSFSNT